MKFRSLAIVAFAASASLAACGGGGGTVTPSTTATPSPAASGTPTPTPSATATPTPASTATPTPSATATPTPSATATPTPASAVFTGGTQTVSMPSSGGTFTISPADNTYSGSLTFGANNASSAFTFTASWATFSQITGTFVPGALTSSIGTALLYLDLKSAVTVSFTQTPGATVTTTGSFPGTSCGFAVYSNNTGTGKQWNSMTTLGLSEVTPSGGTFTIPAATLPPPNTVDFQGNTDQYIALYCH